MKSKNPLFFPTCVMGSLLVILLVVIFVLPKILRQPQTNIAEEVDAKTVVEASTVEEETETQAFDAEFYIDPITIDNIKTLLKQNYCAEDYIDTFAEYLFSAVTDPDAAWSVEVHDEPTPWVALLLWDDRHLAAQVQAFYGDYTVLYDAVNYGYTVYHNDQEYHYTPKFVSLTVEKMGTTGNWTWTPFEAACLLAVLEEYAPFESYDWNVGTVETQLFLVTYSEGIFTLQNKDDKTIEKVNLYANVTGLTASEMIQLDPDYHDYKVINTDVVNEVIEEKELQEWASYITPMFDDENIRIYDWWFLDSDAEFIYLKTITPNINMDDGLEINTLAHVSKIDGALYYK